MCFSILSRSCWPYDPIPVVVSRLAMAIAQDKLTISTLPLKVHTCSQGALRANSTLDLHTVFWWCSLHYLRLEDEAGVSPLCY